MSLRADVISPTEILPPRGTTSPYENDQPSEGGQIVLFKCLDVYHKSPDSGERQCKSRICRRRCDPPCGQARRRGRSGPSPMIGVPRSPHLFTTHCRNPQESLQDKACEDSCGDGLAACHRQCKGAVWIGRILHKMCSIYKISRNEVHYTIVSIYIVKIMLCSRLHCQNPFKLKNISFKVGGHLLGVVQVR